MTDFQRDIRKSLDRMVADNGGPFRAYNGNSCEIRDEQWHLQRAREVARHARQYKQKKSARAVLIESLLALPDAERAEAIKLLNRRNR